MRQKYGGYNWYWQQRLNKHQYKQQVKAKGEKPPAPFN
jgi:hypothetical protein